MERIASFSVDHLLLEPGVYVSRIDRDPATGAAVTTFDLRLTTPNKEPVMNTAECHTIEHLGATFLRNHAEWSSRIVYFAEKAYRQPVPASLLKALKLKKKGTWALEPSAGIGAFVDSVLDNNPKADIMAFEKDLRSEEHTSELQSH